MKRTPWEDSVATEHEHDSDLTELTPEELDHFAAWAHAVNGTPGVTIIEGDPHEVIEQDAAHGHNDEAEMAVD